MSKEEQDRIASYVDTMMSQPGMRQAILHYVRELSKIPDKPSRAYSALKLIDEIIKNETKLVNIKCGRGCSYCCHILVGATDCERELLKEVLKDSPELTKSLDKDRIKKQAKYHTNQPFEFADEVSLADRRCAFLDEKGECRIYEYRPSACRLHLVTSEPERCDTSSGLQQEITEHHNMNAHAVQAALVMIDIMEGGVLAGPKSVEEIAQLEKGGLRTIAEFLKEYLGL